jgi:hypothetical protein
MKKIDRVNGAMEMKFVDRVGQRRVCDGCGAIVDKGEAVAGFETPDGGKFLVCRECLQAPDSIDMRIGQHADEIERLASMEAQALRSVIGKLKLPDYDAFRAADQFHWDQYFVVNCTSDDEEDQAVYAASVERLQATEEGRKFLAEFKHACT